MENGRFAFVSPPWGA